jgi:hypothetical protein
MISELRLITTVLLHKWYVLRAGRRLKVPFWNLVVHDLSKFSRAEFRHYARKFYGGGGDDYNFCEAWWHHYFHNPHHWEYWVSRDPRMRGIPTAGTRPMPEVCVREMVADWFAAGKAYNGAWPDPANLTWLKANRHRLQLHPTTERRLNAVLAEAATFQW